MALNMTLLMLLIEDVLTLLMMLNDCCRSVFCCCVVCLSQLSLPLSDRVPVVVALLLLWYSCCTWREDVMVTKMLIENVLTLLMLIMDC